VIKYKTEKVEQKITESIICDRCGREYDTDTFLEAQEFLHIDFVGGYGSIFGDGSHIRCDLCQHCLMDLIQDFYREEGY